MADDDGPKEPTDLLAEVIAALPHAECRSCECFQAFLTQLELDGFLDGGGHGERRATVPTARWKVDRAEMHACLGCAPCPPSEAYTRYLRDAGKRL